MYPPHHLGGYELTCRDCVTRWRADGHEVEVLTSTMRLDGVDDPAGERGEGVRRELTLYWRDHEVLSPSLVAAMTTERHNQRVLATTLDEVRPDVVSVWHMGAMSIGLLTTLVRRSVPMTLVVCDEWLSYGPRIDPWLGRFLGRRRLAAVSEGVSRLPTRVPVLTTDTPVCFVSDWIRQRARERSAIEFPTSTVVYSGIDLTDFPVVERPDSEWTWKLLCVGRQEERKGTHVAIRALAHLPSESRLDVVGPHEDRAYVAHLSDLAREVGAEDRVSFRSVERSQLRDAYGEADAFLFPVIWDEPFGLVPLEAMACGTPVVATATGGSAEFLIDGVNSVRVPPNDPLALASAVERLAADPALRSRVADGGRRTAVELTIDRLADVLGAWHLAAASRFADGRPPDLPPPLSTYRAAHGPRD